MATGPGLSHPTLLLPGVALLALTLLRLVVAADLPLAPDETYYWIWSHALAPGYLDHPPMVALWIRAGCFIAGETPLGIRLLGPLSAVLGSLLLFDAARLLLASSRAACIAAGMLNATVLFGVGTVIMTPDTPLLFFWTAALWAAVRAGRSGGAAWWVTAGLCTGLAMASKYTAVLLCVGLGLWVLASPALRAQLRRPGPWLGAAASIIVFSPVIAWNATHGWASFLRQGGRTADWQPARALGFIGELIGGQIALATPFVFVLCVAGVGWVCRLSWKQRHPGAMLLAALTLPGAILFLQHAIGDRVQGNWPAILYPAACLAAAGLPSPFFRRLTSPAILLGLACTLVVYAQASTGLLSIPPRRDPVALQLSGWRTLAHEVEQARATNGASYVVADQYTVASELAYLLPPNVPVFGAEDRWALTSLPREPRPEGNGILVTQAHAAPPGAPELAEVARGSGAKAAALPDQRATTATLGQAATTLSAAGCGSHTPAMIRLT